MINLIPAAPDTFIIELVAKGQQSYTPVVGWQHVQGNVVFPLCATNHGGLAHGKAIQHPDGTVEDPTHKLVFSDSSEWEAYILVAQEAPAAAKDEGHTSEDGESGTTEPSGANASPRPRTAERATVAVAFGTKTYKTKSFWAFADEHAEGDAIFEIEGEQPYPNDARCSKITRDEFLALKKQGTPHAVAVTFSEAQAEDDDDGMDLV